MWTPKPWRSTADFQPFQILEPSHYDAHHFGRLADVMKKCPHNLSPHKFQIDQEGETFTVTICRDGGVLKTLTFESERELDAYFEGLAHF